MGFDHFYNGGEKNEEIIEKRGMFFTQISREKLSKKKHVSKDKYISKKPDKIIFKTDLSINDIRKSFSKDISSFLSSKKYNYSEETKNDDLKDKQYSTSSNSTTEDFRKTNISIKNQNINSILDTNETSRKSFYQKLISKNILNINKEKIKNNTLFIFDWDDTLFFTTHLNPSKNNLFFYENENEKRMMKSIEYYIEEIFNKALNKGTVLIITNSSEGWVEACARFYYPNLISVLKDIYIISSRELYQEKYPREPETWKIRTFNDLKEKFNFEECVSNIICFGDDNNEIIAAKKLGENINNCLIKTVKFRDKPNLKEIFKQLILINLLKN